MVAYADTAQAHAATSDRALRFQHVSFAYRRDLVVRDVSLRVARGEMIGLLGPNGAGKSTVLRLASGILRPASGEIYLGSADLRGLARDEVARRVAVVPQEFTVQFAYTVRQIVELGRMPHMGAWGISSASDRAAIAEALEATETAELADRVFNELSGGERQRVLIALAVAQDAALFLLDEPTAHLDIKHQIEVLELMRRLNRERGITVIAALHDLNLAARYFPRLMLFRTEILADGPPARVLDGTLLSQVYETPVQVGILRGEEHLSVLPPGRVQRNDRPAPAASAESPVHVLAGGGSGELLMRALADAGVAFTAGPLNAGDSDCALAGRLARLCIVEPPYAPVSRQGLLSARERMEAADAIVVCPMPLGPGNQELLQAALDACRAGRGVIVLEPALRLAHESGADGADAMSDFLLTPPVREAIGGRDFSGRGLELYAALAAAGARWAASPVEAVEVLGLAPAPKA
jgi:cobalamin transport system ATP-binding protein